LMRLPIGLYLRAFASKYKVFIGATCQNRTGDLLFTREIWTPENTVFS
jgi:hypothetical protein